MRESQGHYRYESRFLITPRSSDVHIHSLPRRLELSYHGRAMAKSTKPIPEGFRTLTLHLTVNGAADYIDFLKRAFNAVEVARSPGPGGKLMHAHMRIGDSDLMLNDSFPEFGSPTIAEGPWPLTLHMYVTDADAAFARAVAAGCTVTMPLADQFWGDRYGHVKDPFGFVWAIATHIEDPTPEEIQEREAKLFGSGAKA
jgi:PhnB protein